MANTRKALLFLPNMWRDTFFKNLGEEKQSIIWQNEMHWHQDYSQWPFFFAVIGSSNLGTKTTLIPKWQIHFSPSGQSYRTKLDSFHSIIRESWAWGKCQALGSLNSDLLPAAYEPVNAVGRRSICYILCLTDLVLCAENFTSKQFFPLYCDLSLHPLNLSLSAEPSHHVLQ